MVAKGERYKEPETPSSQLEFTLYGHIRQRLAKR
jgi:hypothetical protein